MSVVIPKIVNNFQTFVPEIEPTAFSIQKSDLSSDSTGRSAETGVLLMYPIRRNIYTIKLEYFGSDGEISAIEAAINNSSLEVTFLENGKYKTLTMYPSDREKATEFIRNGVGFHRLSFSLIQY